MSRDIELFNEKVTKFVDKENDVINLAYSTFKKLERDKFRVDTELESALKKIDQLENKINILTTNIGLDEEMNKFLLEKDETNSLDIKEMQILDLYLLAKKLKGDELTRLAKQLVERVDDLELELINLRARMGW